MADNVAVTAGAGTTIAADDIGAGVLAQRVKPVWGADGTGNDVNTTTPLPIQLITQSSGGPTKHSISSAATTNATSVKGSAGQVYKITVTNNSTSARYFKMYNKASAPTVGSDTPVWRIMIPASGGFVDEYVTGLPFATGIAYALTTGAADSNSGGVGADEVQVNLTWT